MPAEMRTSVQGPQGEEGEPEHSHADHEQSQLRLMTNSREGAAEKDRQDDPLGDDAAVGSRQQEV